MPFNEGLESEDNDDNKYTKIRVQRRKQTLFVIGLSFGFLAALVCHYFSKDNEVYSLPTWAGFNQKAYQQQQLLESIQKVTTLDTKVRAIRQQVDIFETNANGQAAQKELQDATRDLLHLRYGIQEPYRVRVDLEFQPSIPDFQINGPFGSFLIELAPSTLQPHSIYTFLEVCRWFKKSAFHRIAPHVLQTYTLTNKKVQHLAFQEYSPEWPHVERTVGYAGRPSGPDWYVSIMDNANDHGPGTQQKKNPYEADSCFGKVIEGYETVVKRISKVPGKEFVSDEHKHVIILKMVIMVSTGNGDYVEWKDTEMEGLAGVGGEAGAKTKGQ